MRRDGGDDGEETAVAETGLGGLEEVHGVTQRSQPARPGL